MEKKREQSFVDFDKMTKVNSTKEFESIINGTHVKGGIGLKTLENLDLTDVDLSKGNWNLDGWYINNVAFSRFRKNTDEKKIIFGLSCMGAYLHRVSFVQSRMIRCNFDTKDIDATNANNTNNEESTTNSELDSSEVPTPKIKEGNTKVSEFETFYNVKKRDERKSNSILEEVDFSMSELEFCRFRNTYVMAADFRYSHIKDCSMSEGKFFASDFYFCCFKDATNFIDSRFIRCSFTNAIFENNCIRLKNIPNGILQEDYKAYHFIISNYDNWIRINPCSSFSDLNHEERRGENKLSKIYIKKESAEFYKQLSGIYAGKGLNRDSNKAYEKSKNNELCYYALSLVKSVKELALLNIFRNLAKLIKNIFIALFGYGYKWQATVFWFAILIIVYGSIYYSNPQNKEGIEIAMSYSFNNSLGPYKDFSEYVNLFFASCQTAIGTLLIGFLGFILANNLRNDS